MKLESIKTFVVANPPPGFGGKYFVFVKIRTTCGIEGVGEAYAATFSPHIIAAMAEDLFARVFAFLPVCLSACLFNIHAEYSYGCPGRGGF